MKQPRLAQHLVPEVPRQIFRRLKVHGASEHRPQVRDHPAKEEQARSSARQKLDEHVHIAGRAEAVPALGRGFAENAPEK